MARVKLREYTAKKILLPALSLPFTGVSLSPDSYSLEHLSSSKKYVVKVDQGIKKRFKLGLIKLGISKADILSFIKDWQKKGYTSFLVEEYLSYPEGSEKYLSFDRTREGILCSYSVKGGVDIESNQDLLRQVILSTQKNVELVTTALSLPSHLISPLIECMNKNHISFLEINPLVITNDIVHIIDLAVEVDSSADFLLDTWQASDLLHTSSTKNTPEEDFVSELARNSQASFKLSVLNPNGSIFLLLSGGGASVVVADEAYNVGFGGEIANYGEYSGNPNQEETYLYTKQLLSLLLKSKAAKKALVIGGGIANFTDVRITFKGIIQALVEEKDKLKKEELGIFVRRGGPNQQEGNALLKKTVQELGLNAEILDPKEPLTKVVDLAVDFLKKGNV